MRLVFRPEAERELLEAQAWYDLQAPGLGLEFARMADAAISSIMRGPLSYHRIEGDYRRILFRRFPYMFIYLPHQTEILVVSCFHQKREPNTWLNNLPDSSV
jgi:plasmid stabilization system protein ParE